MFRHIDGMLYRILRIGGAGFLHDSFAPVDKVLPGAAVPVIVADHPQDTRPGFIQHHVPVLNALGCLRMPMTVDL